MSGQHGVGNRNPSTSSTYNTVNNTDARQTLQGGFALGENASMGNVNWNDTDAVRAIAGMGMGSVVATSGAVVDLTGWAIDRNLDSLDNLTNRSVDLVDSIVDRTYGYSREAQEQATFAITQANQSAIRQINDANALAARTAQAAQDAALYQVQQANSQASAQVRAANDSATRVTSESLAGARSVITNQSSQIDSLARSTQALGASLSQAAMAAYQPGENKALDSIKTMGIAGAVILGLYFVMRGAKS